MERADSYRKEADELKNDNLKLGSRLSSIERMSKKSDCGVTLDINDILSKFDCEDSTIKQSILKKDNVKSAIKV